MLATAAALALVACGSDDDGGESRPEGITDQQGNSLQLRTSHEDVYEQFGEENIVLTSGAEENTSGCEYYAMKDRPLVNVWQVCFNDRDEVKQIATQYGFGTPPEDASPARQALIGRADAICQSENQELRGITRELGEALTVFSQNATPKTRADVAGLIDDFNGTIESTIERIEVYEAPEDGREVLTAYLDLLGDQAGTLDDAREAFLNDELGKYDRLGNEFTTIGEQAKAQAQEYGFSACSASSFR